MRPDNAMTGCNWAVLLVFAFSVNLLNSSTLGCDPVPRHLQKSYQRLMISRKQSTTGTSVILSNRAWRDSSLQFIFNLSILTKQVKLYSADLMLYRNSDSFLQTLIYQQSFRLSLKDVNSSQIIYNRTLSSDKSFCLVKDILQLVKRWHTIPASNQGLVLIVKDTGMYSNALKTFYPRKNITVPALALFLSPGNNYLRRYQLIPSKVHILKKNT